MRLFAASLVVLLGATGCATIGSEINQLPAAKPAAPLGIVLGAATSRPSYWGPDTSKVFAGVLAKAGVFRDVVVAEPGTDVDADVTVFLKFFNTNGGMLTAKAATGEVLVSREISCGFKGLTAYPDCVGRGVSTLIYKALDGTALLAKLQVRRSDLVRSRPAAPSASSPAQAALTREDIQRIMAEAMKAAQTSASPSSTPAGSDVDSPRYRLPERAEDFAIIAGVEKYSALPAASYAENDARAVYAHVQALGVPARNIALLTGEQATRSGLVKNLERWLPQNVGENSTVYFFWSGHGAPDPATGAAYLVPADGDPQYLEDTAYPVKRVYEKLGALKAKRVLVALDSCFSGAGGRSVLAKGTRPLVGKIDLGGPSARTAALSASGPAEISGAYDSQGHGLFTYYLLRGLNGEAAAPGGAVTVKSLFDYLSPKVRDEAKRANREQSPRLQAADDFRLR